MRVLILLGYMVMGALQGWAYLLGDDGLPTTPTTAMGTLIFVTVSLIVLTGWIVKRQFDRNDKQGEQIQAMLLTQQELASAVKANQETLIRQGDVLVKQGATLENLTKTAVDLHGISQEVLDGLVRERRARDRGHDGGARPAPKPA